MNFPFYFHVDNIVRELETFLADIEEIEGSLSIVRSFPLISLGFFKKLRIVRGQSGGKDPGGKERYGLKVVENQNLQALFTQNVTIKHGRIFFHFNPKLCMNIIEGFRKNVEEIKSTEVLPADEVAPNSNGDKIACNVTTLSCNVTKLSYNVAILELEPLQYEGNFGIFDSICSTNHFGSQEIRTDKLVNLKLISDFFLQFLP